MRWYSVLPALSTVKYWLGASLFWLFIAWVESPVACGQAPKKPLVNIKYGKYLNTANVKYVGVGFRFGTDLQRITAFDPAIRSEFAPNYFSNLHAAVWANFYRRGGGMEVSLAYQHKSPSATSSFPLFMQDYGRTNQQNTSYNALEAAFRVGPRLFRILYPKFGLAFQYRFRQSGLHTPDSGSNNRALPFYLSLPMGFTLDLPTGFGTTGIGFFYNVGLTDFVRGTGFERGGRMSGFHLHLHVNFYTTEGFTFAQLERKLARERDQQQSKPVPKPRTPTPPAPAQKPASTSPPAGN